MSLINRTILYVEDSETDRASLSDAIKLWNGAHEAEGKNFKIVFANNAEQARNAIESLRIDCALLDLRLPKADAAKEASQTGNDLVKSILGKRGVPLAVISGHPDELDRDGTVGDLIAAFNKGDVDAYENAVKWLGGQWQMLQVLADARASIDQTTSDVFVKRIWPQWKVLMTAADQDTSRMVTIISRQYMSHAAEWLGTDQPGNHPWHQFENYVIPPLIDHRSHTGDIFELDGALWIVLTPQCDMAENNVNSILLAKCEVDVAKYNKKLTKFKANRTDENASKDVRDLINQNIAKSEHFLPPLPGKESPVIVNFRELRVVERLHLENHLGDRRASVSMPFLPNLVQRFGAFLTRTGQPNIDVTSF